MLRESSFFDKKERGKTLTNRVLVRILVPSWGIQSYTPKFFTEGVGIKFKRY
jgi:hypothetical protein